MDHHRDSLRGSGDIPYYFNKVLRMPFEEAVERVTEGPPLPCGPVGMRKRGLLEDPGQREEGARRLFAAG